MKPRLPLGLRNNAHEVTVIKIEGSTRPVLGTADPQQEERRTKLMRQWGQPAAAPRAERLATIDQPLSQRSQTILSHEVGPALRQRLNGGVSQLAGSRLESQTGIQSRLPLTQADADD